MSDDKSIPISPAALSAFAQAAPAYDSASLTETSPKRSHALERASLEDHADAGTENMIEEDGIPANEDPRYPITVLPGFCTRLAGSVCERCALVCPFDAISFDSDGRPRIDTAFCTRCGLCCGICDTFVTERITMNDLLDKVRRLSAEGDPVFFTCYDQIPDDFEVHPNVIALPCIGAVAPEFWAASLEITPDIQIYCNFALCNDCPTAGPDARGLLTHAVNLGEVWTQIHMGKADRLPEKADILSRFFEATGDEFQRRGIATSLVDEAKDIASGKHRRRNSETLSSYHERKEHLRAQGHATNARHHEHIPSTVEMPIKKVWPRLKMIATTVEEHPDIAANIPRYLAAADDELCARCYEPCFSHCPSGARSVNGEGAIEIDPHFCIACGNCALYCPNGAAFLIETDGSIFLEDK